MRGGTLMLVEDVAIWNFVKVQIVGPDAPQDDAEVVEEMARETQKT